MAASDLVTKEDLDSLRRELAELRAMFRAGAILDVLTTEQAASLARVTPKTIRAWVEDGSLRAGRRGRRLVIRRADLEARLAGPAAALLSTLTDDAR